MKGTTVAMALKCAVKVKKGEKCTLEELRASLDTLAYAYNKVKPSVKRVTRKTRPTVKRIRRFYHR